MLSLTIVCAHGNPSDVCSGSISLTAHETTQGGSPVAVTSSAHKPGKRKPKPKPKPKKQTKQLTLATANYSLPTGNDKTIRLSLSKAGTALLNRFYRLPASLALR